MSTSILFAAGPSGISLNIPESISVTRGAEIDPAPARTETEQRQIVVAAMNAPESGQPLSALAANKRRAVILIGDLSRPASYDIILPVIVETLTGAGIRPSRIAMLACPGGCGPLLGRAAIHRYGEEICAEHEVAAWPADNSVPSLYSTADLRIAVASHSAIESFDKILPAPVDFALEISLGKKISIDIESTREFNPGDRSSEANDRTSINADVWIMSGGGSAWEETLEESMLSFHRPNVSCRSAVVVFSGHEGIGSAHFTRDIWSLIEQADEVLSQGGTLGPTSPPGRYDPAGTLADCLRRYSNTVLFSPGFAAHSEGEDLLERLEEAPRVAGRLALCSSQEQLWKALELLHGAQYSVYAEPLGWRGRA